MLKIINKRNVGIHPLNCRKNSIYYTKSQLSTSGNGGLVHWDNITGTPTLVTKIIAGSNVTISPISGLGDVTINAANGGGGGGDMSKSTYDANLNNKVDLAENTESFGGQFPSAFSSASHNHDSAYSLLSHNHDGAYAPLSHNHFEAIWSGVSGSNALEIHNNGTGNGISGNAASSAAGVTGYSSGGYGVFGTTDSTDGSFAAVGGIANAGSPAPAIKGLSYGTGSAIYGNNLGTLNGTGVSGIATSGYGVYGTTYDTGPSYAGVYGETTGSATAVKGQNYGSGNGVVGIAAYGNGVYAYSQGGIGLFASSTNNTGIYGSSTNGIGIYGYTTTGSPAIKGENAGSGAAVYASNYGTGNAIEGYSTAAMGTSGWTSDTTGNFAGVYGATGGPSPAIKAYNSGSGQGVNAYAIGGAGVSALSTDNFGVWARSVNSYGLYAQSNTTTAGYFRGFSASAATVIISNDSGVGAPALSVLGATTTTGNMSVGGTLSKAAGSFLIDHPLDPENKVLRHSFVESPDMKNIYDGTIILDANGQAVVEMPAYFDALNVTYRYQLTSIGKYMPLFVKEKIANNRFVIASANGAKDAGAEVSWQVTGVRNDAYAQKHRIVVEEEKGSGTASNYKKGEYLSPDAYGVKTASVK